MTTGYSFGRSDGGADLYNDTATVGSITVANQTTLVAAATVLQSALAVVTLSAAKAVTLPKAQAVGSPIVVTNASPGASTLTVFPPWDVVAGAAAGGKIYGAATGSPTANAGVAVAQGRTVTFWPHPNGIDWTAVWGAVA